LVPSAREYRNYQLSQDILLGQWPDEDRRWRLLQTYYFNCIRDCDRHVVQLLEELKANGFDGSTIVVLTADHGELRGAHQMRGKGCNAYKEQNHVPLAIVHPAYRRREHEGGILADRPRPPPCWR
jgi:arylsulfatase A-like enzyme